MYEQMIESVRRLPRQRLEELAIRALAEVRAGREEHSPNAYFHAMLAGLFIGTVIASVGFAIGAALR